MEYFKGLEYILSVAVITIELICTIQIMGALLNYKENKRFFIVAFLGWVVVLFLTFNFFNTTQLQKSISTVVLSFVFSSIIYRGKVVIKIFSALISHIILFVVGSVSYTLLMICFEINSAEVLETPSFFMFGAVINYSFAFIVSYIFGKIMRYRKTGETTGSLQWLAFFLYTSVSILGLILIFISQSQQHNPSVLYIFLSYGLLFSNIGIVLILEQIDKSNALKFKYSVLAKETQNKKAHIEELENLFSEQRKLSHEFKNHLVAIRGLLKDVPDNRELIEYLRTINSTEIFSNMLIDTGNSVVDLIFSQRHQTAKKKGVLIEYRCGEKFKLPISIEEFVVIISNVLDNAINAAELSEDKRVIVKLSGSSDGVVFSVKNTCKEKVEIENNKIIFEKKDKLHGFGLQNIYSILDKYKILYTYSYQQDWLQFVIAF